MGAGWTRRERCIKYSTIFSPDTKKPLQWSRSAGRYRNRQPIKRKSEALLLESTDLGGVKTSLCLHIQQIACKGKEKVKIKFCKCLIRQRAMEAWDGMVVQLHAFLAWTQDGGESSGFTPRSLCHLRNSCCVPNEVGEVRSMSGLSGRQKNFCP